MFKSIRALGVALVLVVGYFAITAGAASLYPAPSILKFNSNTVARVGPHAPAGQVVTANGSGKSVWANVEGDHVASHVAGSPSANGAVLAADGSGGANWTTSINANVTGRINLTRPLVSQAQASLPQCIDTAQNGILTSATAAGSTDTRGIIVTTGTNNNSGNTQIDFTPVTPYATTSVMIITPANESARTTTYYTESSGLGTFRFFIRGGGSDPRFNYFVIE